MLTEKIVRCLEKANIKKIFKQTLKAHLGICFSQ